MKNLNLTKELSNFIVKSRIEDFPEEVIEHSKRCFLDWIGVTLGGMNHPSVKILADLIQEIGGKKQASIIGYGIKTNIFNAALVNGTMSHILDYDDAHLDSRSHPSAPLIPALLSIAEYKKLSGADLITSFILGFDVSIRIGLALGKTYYDLGWHATPILGRFGSAAGVGKLLGLNVKGLANALGLAATQAGGIRRVFGTMGKPFHAGKAALDGMLSAMLAQRGFTAPEDVLDEQSGFPQLFSAHYDSDQITNELGKSYQVLTVSFKPHAACLAAHPVIDGLISIKDQHHLTPELIDEINLEVAPMCLTVTDNADPKNGLEGKFSVYFCAALAIVEGQARHSQFTDRMVHNPRIRGLMGKIKVVSNQSLKEAEANAVVRLKNGAQHTKQVSAPKGDPRNPLSFGEIVEKFKDLSKNVLPEHSIQRIIGMIQDLEKVKNILGLLRLCSVEKVHKSC